MPELMENHTHSLAGDGFQFSRVLIKPLHIGDTDPPCPRDWLHWDTRAHPRQVSSCALAKEEGMESNERCLQLTPVFQSTSNLCTGDGVYICSALKIKEGYLSPLYIELSKSHRNLCLVNT